jgi:hypothetical protein
MALTRPKYSQIYDTDWKQSVELATTADVGNLVLANVQPNSIDGITVQTNYRILVKDQDSGAQNGIYLVRNAGTGSNGWWTRSLDAAQSSFVTAGLAVNVVSGTVNGGKEFKLTTPDPINLGTTVLTFIDPNAAAGAGGANTYVQFNDASVLNGSAGFTFNKFTNAATISGNVVTTSGYFVGNGAFLTGIISGGSGTVNYTTSNSAPTSPQTGDFWYNSSIDVLLQYTNDGVGNVWVDIAGPSIQASGVVFDSGLSFTGNISSTNGYFLGNGSQLTGIVTGSSYSNVQVATYLPTYAGNIANVRLGVAGVLTFADSTTQTTAAVNNNFGNVNVSALITTNGLTNYSNANVTAYTVTMGFTNFSNVNVSALITTNGLTNYSNVNVASYLAGNITVGNIIVPTGAGQFNGPYNESTTVAGVYAGNLNLSPRVGFFNGTAAQNWQIDNNFGAFRWYTPGVTRMQLDSNGNLTVNSYANISLGSVNGDSALQIVGNVSRGGASYHDFLRVTSRASGATNPNKHFRLNGSGNLEIINSAYSSVLLSLTDSGILLDNKGDVRSSPINSQPGNYVPVASDAGKTITVLASLSTINFNASVFAAGDLVSVINTSAGNITLVQGTNVTLRLAGTATTGNRTVASNGLATLICSVGGATPTFYCSGAGLT